MYQSINLRHHSEHLLHFQSRESTSSWRSWGISVHAMWYHWEQLSQATQPPSESSSVSPHTGHTSRFLSDSSVELDSDSAKESSSTTGLLLETGALFPRPLVVAPFFHCFAVSACAILASRAAFFCHCCSSFSAFLASLSTFLCWISASLSSLSCFLTSTQSSEMSSDEGAEGFSAVWTFSQLALDNPKSLKMLHSSEIELDCLLGAVFRLALHE